MLWWREGWGGRERGRECVCNSQERKALALFGFRRSNAGWFRSFRTFSTLQGISEIAWRENHLLTTWGYAKFKLKTIREQKPLIETKEKELLDSQLLLKTLQASEFNKVVKHLDKIIWRGWVERITKKSCSHFFKKSASTSSRFWPGFCAIAARAANCSVIFVAFLYSHKASSVHSGSSRAATYAIAEVNKKGG